MATPKFQIGMKVFAKMRGYPPWPAIVESVSDLTPKRIKYSVYFYGTKQIGICKEEELCCYVSNKEKYGKPKKKNVKFNSSIEEAEADVGFGGMENISNYRIIQPYSNSIEHNVGNAPQVVLENEESQSSPSEVNSDSDRVTSYLEKQRDIIRLVVDIQGSLGPIQVNTVKALNCFEKLETIAIDKLISLKYPDIVNTMIHAQQYIGNVPEWNLSENKVFEFYEHANEIRTKAGSILNTIQKEFGCTNLSTFIEVFQLKLERFQSMTENLKRAELLALTEDELISLELKQLTYPSF